MIDLKTQYPVGSVWRWANGDVAIVLDHKDPSETFPLVVAVKVVGQWTLSTLGEQLNEVTERVAPPGWVNEPIPTRNENVILSDIADRHDVEALVVLSPEQYGNLFVGAHDRVGEVAVAHIAD